MPSERALSRTHVDFIKLQLARCMVSLPPSCVCQLSYAFPCSFERTSDDVVIGKVTETPQKETTPFHPRSPYAVTKVFAYWTVVNYREAYGMFAVNGILFNHESPRRGPTFVTRKITRAVARIKLGLQSCLYLGTPVYRHRYALTRFAHLLEPLQGILMQAGTGAMPRTMLKRCG